MRGGDQLDQRPLRCSLSLSPTRPCTRSPSLNIHLPGVERTPVDAALTCPLARGQAGPLSCCQAPSRFPLVRDFLPTATRDFRMAIEPAGHACGSHPAVADGLRCKQQVRRSRQLSQQLGDATFTKGGRFARARWQHWCHTGNVSAASGENHACRPTRAGEAVTARPLQGHCRTEGAPFLGFGAWARPSSSMAHSLHG